MVVILALFAWVCSVPKAWADSVPEKAPGIVILRIKGRATADFAEITAREDVRISPISRNPPTWLPASEVRGERMFCPT